MKIFDKGLILPPLLNIYIDDDDDGDGDGDGDDDDDALPVVVAVPGKAQAFAVYIYTCIYPYGMGFTIHNRECLLGFNGNYNNNGLICG